MSALRPGRVHSYSPSTSCLLDVIKQEGERGEFEGRGSSRVSRGIVEWSGIEHSEDVQGIKYVINEVTDASCHSTVHYLR